MITCRIIHRIDHLRPGVTAEWYQIETIRNGKSHRSADHAPKTVEEARIIAGKMGDWVDPEIYKEIT